MENILRISIKFVKRAKMWCKTIFYREGDKLKQRQK